MTNIQTDNQTPLDLSSIDVESQDTVKSVDLSLNQHASIDKPASFIEPIGDAPRLVEIGKMSDPELNQAMARANQINFSQSSSLLNLGNTSLSDLADVARKLLADRTVEETGEVGKIATSVLEGIKVLRLEDLQKEAETQSVTSTKGLLGKMVALVSSGNSAIRGFTANRKRFLTLMNEQEAKARARVASLSVEVQLLEQMNTSARKGVSELKLDIAAAQIALDRGYAQAEKIRVSAIASGEPTDAAEFMSFHSNLKLLEGKAMELRNGLLRAASLIPAITNTRKASETRIMKINNGLLLVIPSLMSAAALAAANATVKGAENDSNRLEEADRQVLGIATSAARSSATSAARSMAIDHRNIKALADSAQQAIATITDVLAIEKEVDEHNLLAEQELISIRDSLVLGMQRANQKALAP